MSEKDFLIKKAKEMILLDKSVPKRLELIENAMNDVYRYYKRDDVFPFIGIDEQLELIELELMLENEFLPMETEPIYNPYLLINMPDKIETEINCREALEYIVCQERKRLEQTTGNLKNNPLSKLCINSSSDIEEICKKNGIRVKRFCLSSDLSSGLFHCFNIVSFELSDGVKKNYIVDCTYRQFFTLAHSFLNRIGIFQHGLSCSLGRYMFMDESRKKIAEELLKNGYIEMTPEVIKAYFDGFVFSGKHALFYEELDKPIITSEDYVPKYSAEDYLEALYGKGLPFERRWKKFDKMHNPSMIEFTSKSLNKKISK